MALPNTAPFRFTPRGLADAYDSSDMFDGACRKLQNLIFDQSNPEFVIARPGVDGGTVNLSDIAGSGFISYHIEIGDYVYGLVASSLTAGKDQAFCWQLSTSTLIAVTGQTAGNAEGRPTSPATTGDWVPPTGAVIGTKLIITHPGFTGGKFAVIDISTPGSPAYTTGVCATNALPSTPTGVANFNNRAYFICGNQLCYTDVLNALTRTNAGMALTVGDTTSMTALSGLPVQTTSGGVVAALMAFKANSIWQVTGDAAITNSLAINYLSLTVGCQAPRSVATSPLGVFFAGPDTAYLVSPTGAVIAVQNQPGRQADLRQPFSFMTTPTRAAGAFSGNIYRLCMLTIIDGVAGTYDYWFDTRRMRWNGPHTFPYDCVSPAASGFFLVSGQASGNKIFSSYYVPWTGVTYTDDGSTFYCDLKSADLPKHGEMAMKTVVESTIELSSAGTWSFNINAFDDKGNFITSTGVTSSQAGVAWGSNVWGDGTKWTAKVGPSVTYPVNWDMPLVFNKLAIEVVTLAGANVSIGTSYYRAEKLGYMLQP